MGEFLFFGAYYTQIGLESSRAVITQEWRSGIRAKGGGRMLQFIIYWRMRKLNVYKVIRSRYDGPSSFPSYFQSEHEQWWLDDDYHSKFTNLESLNTVCVLGHLREIGHPLRYSECFGYHGFCFYVAHCCSIWEWMDYRINAPHDSRFSAHLVLPNVRPYCVLPTDQSLEAKPVSSNRVVTVQ